MLIYPTIIYLFICIFFFILYAQSAIDKVKFKQENLSWLKSHFHKSIVARFVPLLFSILTILELITAYLFLLNIIIILAPDNISSFIYKGFLFNNVGPSAAYYMSMVTLLSLFFGQRIAKDYEGAKTIAIYFTLNIVAVIFIAEYLGTEVI